MRRALLGCAGVFFACSSSDENGGGGTGGWGAAADGAAATAGIGAQGGTSGSSGGGTAGVGGADAGCGNVWSARFGGAGATIRWAHVSVAPGGELLVSGVFRGTVDFGGGALTSSSSVSDDGFVLKLDEHGQHIWSKKLGDSPDVEIANVRTSTDGSGNVVVSLQFKHSVKIAGGPQLTSGSEFDIAIAKLDAAGTHLWSRQFGGALLERGSAYAHSDGAIALHGHFQSDSLDFGSGIALTNSTPINNDIFAARLDAMGNPEWAKSFGGGGNEIVWGPGGVDANAGAFSMGAFTGGLDLGSAACPSMDGPGSYVAKLAPDGNCQFRVHARPDADAGQSSLVLWYVRATVASGAVVAGALFGDVTIEDAAATSTPLSSAGDSDIALLKLHDTGGLAFAKSFGDAGYQEIGGLAVDPAGNLFVAAYSDTAIDFGAGPLQSAGARDVFVAKLDAGGNHVSSQRYGDAQDQHVSSLSVDADGLLVAAGHFSGGLDLGVGSPLVSAGATDLWVAKLCP